MEFWRFARAHAFAATVVLALAILPTPASAHYVDNEPNDACAQADDWPDNSVHFGFLDGYPADWKDFHRRWAWQGDSIHVHLSIFASDANAITHVVLHSPTCVVAAFNYQGGHADEDITFTATSTGYWYAEVWSQIGWADYDLVFAVSTPPPPCTPTQADPSHVNQVALSGNTYYIEERGNPLGIPVPLSAFLLGPDANGDGIPELLDGQGTWIYEETNGLPGLQRGGIGLWGSQFLIFIGEDPVNDETCGAGPDRIIVSFYTDL